MNGTGWDRPNFLMEEKVIQLDYTSVGSMRVLLFGNVSQLHNRVWNINNTDQVRMWDLKLPHLHTLIHNTSILEKDILGQQLRTNAVWLSTSAFELCFPADFREAVVNLILLSNYDLLQSAPFIKPFKLRFKE